jgi:two-component system, chemotaxis family, protein-glutamate methylesterase/glutaminase
MKSEAPYLWIIGGSAGSFTPLRQALLNLPYDPDMTIVLCLHRLKQARFQITDAFLRIKSWQVTEPDDKTPIEGGCIYIAPADYHLLIEKEGYFSLSVEEPVHFSRPSIDVTMFSLIQAGWPRAGGILLSGANKDGAQGLFKMYQVGYFTAVQDPTDAEVPHMPNAALALFTPHHRFLISDLPALLGKKPIPS